MTNPKQAMNWDEAIKVMRNYRYDRAKFEDRIDEARSVVTREVGYLVDDTEGLGDWISHGDYEGDETPEQIAAEWEEGIAQ